MQVWCHNSLRVSLPWSKSAKASLCRDIPLNSSVSYKLCSSLSLLVIQWSLSISINWMIATNSDSNSDLRNMGESCCEYLSSRTNLDDDAQGNYQTASKRQMPSYFKPYLQFLEWEGLLCWFETALRRRLDFITTSGWFVISLSRLFISLRIGGVVGDAKLS